MAAHVHIHEFVAEHFLTSRMRMPTDDIQLNDVEIVEFFEAQVGQVLRCRASAQRRVGARRLGFSAIRGRQ